MRTRARIKLLILIACLVALAWLAEELIAPFLLI